MLYAVGYIVKASAQGLTALAAGTMVYTLVFRLCSRWRENHVLIALLCVQLWKHWTAITHSDLDCGHDYFEVAWIVKVSCPRASLPNPQVEVLTCR
jgi:hypothetical protein